MTGIGFQSPGEDSLLADWAPVRAQDAAPIGFQSPGEDSLLADVGTGSQHRSGNLCFSPLARIHFWLTVSAAGFSDLASEFQSPGEDSLLADPT